MPSVHDTAAEAETIALGRRMGESLSPGDVVLLYGGLGMGKTAFVRGLAEGIGADPSAVSSPTFTLIQEYRGRLPLYHVDLYRLSEAEADDLGLEELRDGGGVMAIEWADRLRWTPDRAIRVEIGDAGEDRRHLSIDGWSG